MPANNINNQNIRHKAVCGIEKKEPDLY